jgi:hypothetical protein
VNLSNASRTQLSRIPGLNKAIDFICARAQVVFSAQHDPETGAHTAITADSIVVTGDATVGGDGTFVGDVIAEFGTGTEVGLGVLTTVDGAALLTGLPLRHGVLIGGVADGYFLLKRVKSSAFSGGGTYSWAIYDLAASTSNPMLMMALDTGVYSLIDGGSGATTVRVGSGTRPMLEFYSTNGYYERGRTAAPLGDWTTFTPTRTAATGTWTAGTVVTAHYTLVGKTMFVSVAIDGANNSNITASLSIAIPGGFTASKAEYAVPLIEDNGVFVPNVRMRTTAGGTTILFENLAGNIAANAANGLTVRGQMAFEIT